MITDLYSCTFGGAPLNVQAKSMLCEKRTLPEGGFVKMSEFLLDFATEMPYPLAPPQGWKQFGSLKI